MARAVFSSAPLSGAAPFLRAFRLGWRLFCYISAVLRGRFLSIRFSVSYTQPLRRIRRARGLDLTDGAFKCRNRDLVGLGWRFNACPDAAELYLFVVSFFRVFYLLYQSSKRASSCFWYCSAVPEGRAVWVDQLWPVAEQIRQLYTREEGCTTTSHQSPARSHILRSA